MSTEMWHAVQRERSVPVALEGMGHHLRPVERHGMEIFLIGNRVGARNGQVVTKAVCPRGSLVPLLADTSHVGGSIPPYIRLILRSPKVSL